MMKFRNAYTFFFTSLALGYLFIFLPWGTAVVQFTSALVRETDDPNEVPPPPPISERTTNFDLWGTPLFTGECIGLFAGWAADSSQDTISAFRRVGQIGFAILIVAWLSFLIAHRKDRLGISVEAVILSGLALSVCAIVILALISPTVACDYYLRLENVYWKNVLSLKHVELFWPSALILLASFGLAVAATFTPYHNPHGLPAVSE